jgi:hypothetical protein
VPGSLDTAIFDANSTDCVVNAAAAVSNFQPFRPNQHILRSDVIE